MKQGFVKVAACTPKCMVANVDENVDYIFQEMVNADKEHCKIVVFPELCVTGYTCGDLFDQEFLLKKAKEGMQKIIGKSMAMDPVFFVGMPLEYHGALYNVAVAFSKGHILGIIPKTYIPNYKEFYEGRYFKSGPQKPIKIKWSLDEEVWFGSNLLIQIEDVEHLIIGGEICEDLWTPCPPSCFHALAGATVIVNLSASNEVTGKAEYRKRLVENQSARITAAYIYSSAGADESTTDLVYGGHCLIGENGIILAEAVPFANKMVISEIDVQRLNHDRRKTGTYEESKRLLGVKEEDYVYISSSFHIGETALTRQIDPSPFIPKEGPQRNQRCSEILDIQAYGLRKRLDHTKAKTAIIGISGGLDSTLALIVIARAFDLLKIPREQIIAVTMPGFGTTDRTYQNALEMIRLFGATVREIDICQAVNIHFLDIDHDPLVHDVTYENSQARERTQILMDIANQSNGLVIGTGDMSELALGWATYNGDHMSMYGVNASVPKTLVRHLVFYYAEQCENKELAKVLKDVFNTPVSPELLPPEGGMISQKTEELVGPYELHDFFLYYVLRFGFEPQKIYDLCKLAFGDEYTDEEIAKWMQVFYRRFFAQQFKRSCLPDGPKVGTVGISPRGDLRMPSDASAGIWLEQVEQLGK